MKTHSLPVCLTLLVAVVSVSGQVPGRGTGTCSQLINGKYHQVPCTYQNQSPPTPPSGNTTTPPQPTADELDRQAREGEAERKRKEAERQEDALKAADEAAKAADFLKRRDEALTELKDLGSSDNPALKEISDKPTAPCSPSRDASVVDLCFNEKGGKPLVLEMPKDIDAESLAVIKSLQEVAKTRRFTEAEQYRLSKAMLEMNDEGGRRFKSDIIKAWEAIEDRKVTAALRADIRKAKGANVFPAGVQTSFMDCAVFAIATASGRPYGVVAATAAKLITDEAWRPAAERRDPSGVIKGDGLVGGEVGFIAEQFGRVEVVPSFDFAKTLAAGKPIMIGVFPPDADGRHQVVLTKTFEHGGSIWYEMIDSNKGFRRLYLDESELKLILRERGIVYSPEAGSVPKLMR